MFDIVHYTICYLYPDSVNSVTLMLVKKVIRFQPCSIIHSLILDSPLATGNPKTAKQWEKMKRKTDVPPQWSIMQSL